MNTTSHDPTDESADTGANASGCAIDADLLAQMDAALLPEPLDAGTQARIKQKLLRRIASSTTPQHLTVAAEDADWRPFGKGITIKVLHQAGDVMSYLLRLAPGAALAAHRHPVDEECVVLEGEVRVGDLCIAAGGFHLGRKDVLHDRLHSPGGALMFLRGAVPEPELAF
jgi:anti-sigma factor ChrR (cupin superfamily)